MKLYLFAGLLASATLCTAQRTVFMMKGGRVVKYDPRKEQRLWRLSE